MRRWTLSACFAHFGVKRPARHFTGSALSDDGKTVVVALWEDEIVQDNQQAFCLARGRLGLGKRSNQLSKKWITNLEWAYEHNCRMRVVLLKRKEGESEPKRMIACYPNDALVMRITKFDTTTGELRAESV